jgi:RING-box protein 1
MEPFIKIKHMNIISSWTYIAEKNTDCTICRQSINNNSVYAIENGYLSTVHMGNCGHIFHTECIKPWLLKNSKCPICLQPYQL